MSAIASEAAWRWPCKIPGASRFIQDGIPISCAHLPNLGRIQASTFKYFERQLAIIVGNCSSLLGKVAQYEES